VVIRKSLERDLLRLVALVVVLQILTIRHLPAKTEDLAQVVTALQLLLMGQQAGQVHQAREMPVVMEEILPIQLQQLVVVAVKAWLVLLIRQMELGVMVVLGTNGQPPLEHSTLVVAVVAQIQQAVRVGQA
jgi:hypothetical protein